MIISFFQALFLRTAGEASYQCLLRFTAQTTVNMTGTSMSTPTTVASAAPE
jgi:hypothetical protein